MRRAYTHVVPSAHPHHANPVPAQPQLEQATEPDALALRLLRALESFGSGASTMLVVARALRREGNVPSAQTTETEAQRWALSSLASSDQEPLFGVTLRLMRLEALDAACAALSPARGGPEDRELVLLAHSRVQLQTRLNGVSAGLDVGPPPQLLHLLSLFPVAPSGEDEERFLSTPENATEAGEEACPTEDETPLSARKGLNANRTFSVVAAEGVAEAPGFVGVILRMLAAALVGVTVFSVANAVTGPPARPQARRRRPKPQPSEALVAMLSGGGMKVQVGESDSRVVVAVPSRKARFSAEELKKGGYREVSVRHGNAIFA